MSRRGTLSSRWAAASPRWTDLAGGSTAGPSDRSLPWRCMAPSPLRFAAWILDRRAPALESPRPAYRLSAREERLEMVPGGGRRRGPGGGRRHRARARAAARPPPVPRLEWPGGPRRGLVLQADHRVRIHLGLGGSVGGAHEAGVETGSVRRPGIGCGHVGAGAGLETDLRPAATLPRPG